MKKQINRLVFAASLAAGLSIVATTVTGQGAVERARGTSAGAGTGGGAGTGAGTGAAGTAGKAAKGTTSNVKRSGSCGEFKYYDAKSRQCLDSRDKKK